MTIIVYKDGMVAADRLLAAGFSTQHVTKLHVLPDGRLAAGAGTIGNVAHWMATLRGEVPRHPAPDNFAIDGIVISPFGDAELYSGSLLPYPLLNNNFMALGPDAACFTAQVLHHQGMSAGGIIEAIARESGFSGVDTASIIAGGWVVRTVLKGDET